jgi:hypothetical protein
MSITDKPSGSGPDRNVIIDIFKGVMVLHVIEYHAANWPQIVEPGGLYFQLGLFLDVPIFFFLSGYLSFKGSSSDVLRRSVRQFRKLYLEYFVLAAFVALVIFGVQKYYLGYSITWTSILRSIAHIAILKVNLPVFYGLGYVMWFVKSYLVVIVIAPVLALLGTTRPWRTAALTVISLGLSSILYAQLPIKKAGGFPVFDYPIYVTYYAAAFFLGATYRNVESRIKLWHVLITSSLLVVSLLFIIRMDNYRIIIQAHKFPPSLPSFMYSLVFIHSFVYAKSFYGKILLAIPSSIKKLFVWSSREVFGIFLIQSLVCSLPSYAMPYVRGSVPRPVLYLASELFCFSLTLFLVWFLREKFLPWVTRVIPHHRRTVQNRGPIRSANTR